MEHHYILLLIIIIIIACQAQKLPINEDFGVMKRTFKNVKISVKCGFKLAKNTFGIMKDFVTFNWI
jgi:hypothetical protein